MTNAIYKQSFRYARVVMENHSESKDFSFLKMSPRWLDSKLSDTAIYSIKNASSA
jgi:hypothetical protein